MQQNIIHHIFGIQPNIPISRKCLRAHRTNIRGRAELRSVMGGVEPRNGGGEGSHAIQWGRIAGGRGGSDMERGGRGVVEGFLVHTYTHISFMKWNEQHQKKSTAQKSPFLKRSKPFIKIWPLFVVDDSTVPAAHTSPKTLFWFGQYLDLCVVLTKYGLSIFFLPSYSCGWFDTSATTIATLHRHTAHPHSPFSSWKYLDLYI